MNRVLLQAHVDREVHYQFKLAVVRNEDSIRGAIQNLMRLYIEMNSERNDDK